MPDDADADDASSESEEGPEEVDEGAESDVEDEGE